MSSSRFESSSLANFISNKKMTEKSNVLFTVTTLDTSDEFHGTLQQMGLEEIREVDQGVISYLLPSERTPSGSINVGFDEDYKIGIFITRWRKSDEIPKKLEEPLRFVPNIAQLWIKPILLSGLLDELKQNYRGLKVTWFSGISDPTFCTALRRPEVERSLQYSGEDGLETLEEMKREYGIIPKIIEFFIPNVGGYRIDNRGIVTVRQGSLKPVYNTILEAVSVIQPWLKSFRRSQAVTVQSTLSEYSLKIRQVRPWEVKLGRPLFSNELTSFEYRISRERLFSTMNRYLRMEEDKSVSTYYSLYLDESNYTSFGVDFSGSDNSFSVYPDQYRSLPSSIDFISALHDNLEPGIEAA